MLKLQNMKYTKVRPVMCFQRGFTTTQIKKGHQFIIDDSQHSEINKELAYLQSSTFIED